MSHPFGGLPALLTSPVALATRVAEGAFTAKKTAILIGLCSVLLGLGAPQAVSLITGGGINSGGDKVVGNDVLTRYTFDPVQKDWVSTVQTTPVVPNPDGSTPRASNTVEIFLQENEPVRAIVVAEALVIGGTDPLVEIQGRSGGKINICKLLLKQVEAKRLEIKSTEVVRVDAYNTVAQDDELDVEVEPVNVVRCGRGATSVLILGVDKKDVHLDDDDYLKLDVLGKDSESGVRIDRLRVLGPEGKTGFVENLIVVRSSVFGKIDVRDVKIQDLVLDSVTLDDFS